MQAFFQLVITNSYGPLIHALPLSLADKTGSFDLHAPDSPHSDTHDGPAHITDRKSITDNNDDDSVKREKTQQQQRRASVGTVESVSAPNANGKGKAPDGASTPSDADENENPHTANPPEIKPVDEDAGPKEFYHPASVEPQQTVWIPRDELGLADEEEREIRARGISVSTEGARMDAKGHVDISDAPPQGMQVRGL